MAFWNRGQTTSETETRPRTPSEQALSATVDKLPKNVSDWTPEQRAEYAEKSNTVMREQHGTPRALGRRQ
ncbi:hypothetical protein [Streptomyces sp. SGAir0957]